MVFLGVENLNESFIQTFQLTFAKYIMYNTGGIYCICYHFLDLVVISDISLYFGMLTWWVETFYVDIRNDL
jgi:hypothetical protein